MAIDDRARRFVEAFIRPRGIDLPAAEVFADTIEAEGGLGGRTPQGDSALGTALACPAVAACSRGAGRRTPAARGDQAEEGRADVSGQGRCGAGPVTILFAMASPEYLRFYDGTVQLLAARGHRVVLAVNMQRDKKPVRVEGLDFGRRQNRNGRPRAGAWRHVGIDRVWAARPHGFRAIFAPWFRCRTGASRADKAKGASTRLLCARCDPHARRHGYTPPARRSGCARALHSRQPGRGGVRARLRPGRRLRVAARRRGVGPGRLGKGGAGAGGACGGRHCELGQPDEQRAAARPAGPGHRLERSAAA